MMLPPILLPLVLPLGIYPKVQRMILWNIGMTVFCLELEQLKQIVIPRCPGFFGVPAWFLGRWLPYY
jgi:hypothetical protein